MKRIVFVYLMLVLTVCSLSAKTSSFANSDEVKPKGLPSGTLSVRTTIYFGDEDEENEPDENVTFYLLSKSAADMLRNARLNLTPMISQ